MYIDGPIRAYVDDLAAKKPAPGGGSAAALTGALGAALLEMTANFTVGKEKYKEYEPSALAILKDAGVLRKSLMNSVDADVEAYTTLSRVLKAKDGAGLDEALREATRVPLTIAEDAREGLRLAARLASACNPNLISDVGVACGLLSSSYGGAKYNIAINLNSIKREEFVLRTRERLVVMDREVAALKGEIERKVGTIMEKSV